MADAVIAILHRYEINKDLNFGVYHFAGQPAVSLFEFAEHILDSAFRLGLVSKNVNVTPASSQNQIVKRPANSVLDCSKINAEFSICQSDWRRGLERVLDKLAEEVI